VKTASDHAHELETRQGSDVTPPPLDGSEKSTEIAKEAETNIEEEMVVTEMPSAILTMILAAGEMMANAMSA
jgi:hypothetical protein